MKVPFFKVPDYVFADEHPLNEELHRLFEECEFSNGSAVARLEVALKRFTGAAEVVCLGNATDALAIALMAIGVGSGDEVIVPTFTFFASGSSVCHAGGTPVFADINPGTYAIDPQEIERLITPRTKAIMPVHLFSQMAEMDSILKIAKRHNLKVIEDSAEGIGMYHGGTHAGLLGDIGVLSFFPTKTLGALGDAGAVLTNDRQLAETCRMLRNHGRTARNPHQAVRIGFNSRMDSVQAAILLARIKDLPAEIVERQSIAATYSALLRPVSEVTVPRIVNPANNPVFYVYQIETEDRDGLRAYLANLGIDTEVYYPRPIHRQPCMQHLSSAGRSLPNAENACGKTLALPMYPGLSREEQLFICESIKSYYLKVH